MARLAWGVAGHRFYETGVDRGVLYVGTNPGVSWSGLVSVPESPSGGEPKPYYIDGIKYSNLSSAEEFEATINAYSCPFEFEVCDGTVSIQNGLSVTQQARKNFGLSYRTKIGNDVDADSHGYKIHLVYNAIAAPSQRSNKSIGDSIEPETFGWSLTTRPPILTGYKPTAHLVIDSTLTNTTVLSSVEDILYGTDALTSRLPTPSELITIFTP